MTRQWVLIVVSVIALLIGCGLIVGVVYTVVEEFIAW